MFREYLEALLRSGATEKIIDEATEYFRGKPKASKEAVWTAVTACKACEKQKKWGQALEWARLAEEMKDLDLEAGGHLDFSLAVVHMHVGNWPRAECALRSFLVAADQVPALSRMKPWVHFNWAQIMRYLKRHEEEIAHLNRATEGYVQLNLKQEELHSRLEIAWSYLLNNQPALAYLYLNDAQARLEEDGNPDLRADAEVEWALYHLLTHDLSVAEAECKAILAQADVAPRRAADARWILGRVALARRDLSLASEHAEKAKELAYEDYWPLQMGRIEQLLRAVKAH